MLIRHAISVFNSGFWAHKKGRRIAGATTSQRLEMRRMLAALWDRAEREITLFDLASSVPKMQLFGIDFA
jgi:hypothetical protein